MQVEVIYKKLLLRLLLGLFIYHIYIFKTKVTKCFSLKTTSKHEVNKISIYFHRIENKRSQYENINKKQQNRKNLFKKVNIIFFFFLNHELDNLM